MQKLSVPEKHQLKIARRTLQLVDGADHILGGMTKDEARKCIKKLTGKVPKE